MDHLHHLRRDRGCGPWGLYTSPGSPANPALSRWTPGPAGVQDATRDFIAAAARSVIDPLATAVDAARAVAEARAVFAAGLDGALERLIGTDFGRSLPTVNAPEAMPGSGEFPGWFPAETWRALVAAVKAWETALEGLDASSHGDGGRNPGFASDVRRVYAVGGRARRLGADFSGVDTSLPAPDLVEAHRKVALTAAGGALVTAARSYAQMRSSSSARELIDAVAYFDALSPEWRPAVGRRYRLVERWMERLSIEAPDLVVAKNGAGVVVLPRSHR